MRSQVFCCSISLLGSPLLYTDLRRTEYSRGEGGWEGLGGPLWSPVPGSDRLVLLVVCPVL